MSYTNGLDKPSEYFNTVLYTGNATDNHTITGVNFQPDWVWVKGRSEVSSHRLNDAVRGAGKELLTNTSGAEYTYSPNTSLKSFDSDGFTLGTDNGINKSGVTYASWSWLASNTTASNTDGSITSTVSANTTSGFSIVSYTGTANANETVGHGLNSTPDIVLIKNRDRATDWPVINPRRTSTVDTNMTYFNTTSIETDHNNIMGDNLPNATTFGIDDDTSVNVNGENFIAYCWHSVKGFSSFGSYQGSGNADGPFIYTGFKPAMVIIKNMTQGEDWNIGDNKRNITYPSGANVNNAELKANTSGAEVDRSIRGGGITQYDMLSNGIKLRGSNPETNFSGHSYIYMAFAESPLVGTNNTPATAR